jgi:MFS transporter, ACS family, hexuronate transporter
MGNTEYSSVGSLASVSQGHFKRVGWHRWVICGLLFAATAFNYVDRQTIALLQPTLASEYGWSRQDYADVVRWFMTTYAIGYVAFGHLIDRIGAKLGYTIAVLIWTCAHLSCALFGGSLTGLKMAQAGLGFGESGNFPAALKAVAEWFPQKERALANGLFNAGTNVGVILTPVIVPFVVLTFGWRWAFVATGCLSLMWLATWALVYRSPHEDKHVTAEELAYIESDRPPPAKRVPWLKLIFFKETWAFALGKFLTDPVWYFYTFWLPSYFVDTYHLKVQYIAAPIIIIYVISDMGSIAGGWVSSAMIARGATANLARKLTMLLCAFCVLPVAFATLYVHDMWATAIIIGIATAAHQAFSANLYTIPSDTFPPAAVGSVSGIGGTAGALGGVAMAFGVGEVLRATGVYTPVFIVAGLIYFLAVIAIHWLTPRLQMVKIA